MSRVRAYLAVSADGFIADGQGEVGWLEAFQVDLGYQQFLDSVGAIVSGRTTYEQVLGFGDWPYPGKRVVVMTSRTLPDPGIEGVEFAGGDPASLVARLRDEVKGDLWLLGGADLLRRFLEAGVVDTLELYVMPLLLGAGIPLFSNGGPPARLELEKCASHDLGIVELVYRVA